MGLRGSEKFVVGSSLFGPSGPVRMARAKPRLAHLRSRGGEFFYFYIFFLDFLKICGISNVAKLYNTM
jgi:hypothetical protein